MYSDSDLYQALCTRKATDMASSSRRHGFTLLELLIIVGIVGILIALVIPTFSRVRTAASRAREMAAAQQLMLGYLAYAQDHSGRLMPGFYPAGGLKAEDEHGLDLNTISGPVAARYPWRLAPYLDYELPGLYLDDAVLRGFENEAQYHYLVSLYPSLGLNATFVGGDGSSEGLAFNSLNEQIFGRFYVTRMSQPRRPTELIVFASARSDVAFDIGDERIVEGHHIVRPPYLRNRDWAPNYGDDVSPVDFGFVSPRFGRTAVIGFFDGHTGALSETELQDMRHWADQADRPDWTLTPQP